MNPADFRLFYAPAGRLRLETGDRCWIQIRPAWASPLSHPDRYLALLDGKGKEIALFPDPAVLPDEARAVLAEELERRYLSSTIVRVLSARNEFGTTYWSVETDRGARDFVTQSLQENANWLSPTRLMLVDVDGNRYEIKDTEALDPVSRKRLRETV